MKRLISTFLVCLVITLPALSKQTLLPDVSKNLHARVPSKTAPERSLVCRLRSCLRHRASARRCQSLRAISCTRRLET